MSINVDQNCLPIELTQLAFRLAQRTGVDEADALSYLAEAWSEFDDPKLWYTVAFRKCVDHHRRENGRSNFQQQAVPLFDLPVGKDRQTTSLGELLLNSQAPEDDEYTNVDNTVDIIAILDGLPDNDLAALFRHFWLRIPEKKNSPRMVSYIRALRHAKTEPDQRSPVICRNKECPLSTKQLAALTLAAKGLSVKLIALELYVEPNTIKTHLKLVAQKLKSKNTTHSVAIAIQAGWISL